MNEEELEIVPVEIHEELYSANLFGEAVEPSKDDEEKDLIGPKARPAFNIFALTDSVGSRNKREAWMLYRKALAAGMVPEEIFYKLVWQVKTMLMAEKTKSPEEADMKAFPYSKAKETFRRFNEGLSRSKKRKWRNGDICGENDFEVIEKDAVVKPRLSTQSLSTGE